jgi:hypothetical protein
LNIQTDKGDGMRLSIFIVNRATKYRHFALLNSQGCCIAFKSCERMPTQGEWVEITAINLAWFNQTLPGHGRRDNEATPGK